MSIKVAGVTFANENGESRQDILAGLAEQGIITVNLEYTSFEGEPAIKCHEKTTGKVIGWIPKKNIEEVTACKIKQFTGFINFFKMKDGVGRYCAELCAQEKPTAKQYAKMIHLCKEQGIPMPAYDRRAYRKVFDKYEPKKTKEFIPVQYVLPGM